MQNKIRGFEKVSRERWFKDSTSGMWNEIILPKRATSHSAGYDIFSPIDFVLLENDEIKFPTGWKVYMEEDEVLLIYPRSSLGFKYLRLANDVGVIDHDYYNNSSNEGHCWIKLRNEGHKNIEIKRGEAIAQAIFTKYLLADNDDYSGDIRKGGIGSTD